MKKITYAAALLIIFLINPAFGFAGMTANSSDEQIDSNNITESDKDIILLQHLFEVDAVQLQSENKLLVRETLIFKNIGTKNFSGSLRTWVPDEAEGTVVTKTLMMMGAEEEPVDAIQNGNIISWRASIKINDPLLPLYIVKYLLPAEPRGTLTKTIYYSKKLSYPTLINYQYAGRPGLPALIIKVTKPEGSSIELLDENRNKINPDDVSEEGNSILNRFESSQFREINVIISKPAVTPAGIGGYVILGLVIVLVLSYPVIRTKSEKIRALEEKIKTSLKREEVEEVYEEEVEEAAEAEITEFPAEAEEEAVSPAVEAEKEEPEFEGKTREELENLKAEALSKLSELDKEYESGNLLDEEYEELRSSYNVKVEKINKKLEQSQ